MMKRVVISALAAMALMAGISEAGAVVCAAGVYHAGCVGPHGAAVVGRPVGGAVVVRRQCFMRAGVRVCR